MGAPAAGGSATASRSTASGSGSLDAEAVPDPDHLARSPLAGTIALHPAILRDLAQLQRLGVSFPPVVREIGADAVVAEGALTGSLGDPRRDRARRPPGRTGRRGERHHRAGGAAIDTQAVTVATLTVSAKSGEVISRLRPAVVGHNRRRHRRRAPAGSRAAGRRPAAAMAAGGTARAVGDVERLGAGPGDDGTRLLPRHRPNGLNARSGVGGPFVRRWRRDGRGAERDDLTAASVPRARGDWKTPR